MHSGRKLLIGVAATTGAALISTAGLAGAAPGPPLPKATSGAQVVRVAGPGAIPIPTSFAFGKGTVFVGAHSGQEGKHPPRGGVFTFSGGKASLVPGTPRDVYGVTWKAGTLYVSSGRQIIAYAGWNGTTFASKTAVLTASKSLPAIGGLAFGPNGRLYAGALLSEAALKKYDHTTNPAKYAQAVFSLRRNGTDLRLVAEGIRQPFQLVFVNGHRYPYVSNLSQDNTPKINPPDFIVNARPGQDYGFAKCTWFKPKACKGYARPVKFLPPHTSPMGLGSIGQTLYIAEFGKQRVVKMSLKTKVVKNVLTGFAAPIVGLGIHNGFIYVGELTGSVYRVKA
jgi:glucose/arabinose dehydrogenase